MASTCSSSLTISSSSSSSSSSIVDRKAPRQSTPSSPQSVSLPTLPPPPSFPSQNRPWKTTTTAYSKSITQQYCRKLARNVMAMATGEAQADVATTELPEVVKTVQKTWEKIEDKYAVSSLSVAAVVALWGSTGVISAIDRLPLVPGVLEVVGIGYTGWFVYKNLIYKPDREALLQKIKETYNEIIGSSS